MRTGTFVGAGAQHHVAPRVLRAVSRYGDRLRPALPRALEQFVREPFRAAVAYDDDLILRGDGAAQRVLVRLDRYRADAPVRQFRGPVRGDPASVQRRARADEKDRPGAVEHRRIGRGQRRANGVGLGCDLVIKGEVLHGRYLVGSGGRVQLSSTCASAALGFSPTEDDLILTIPFMVRQAHHERNEMAMERLQSRPWQRTRFGGLVGAEALPQKPPRIVGVLATWVNSFSVIAMMYSGAGCLGLHCLDARVALGDLRHRSIDNGNGPAYGFLRGARKCNQALGCRAICGECG
ncbi:MAG TPA: hypothetical protein VFQ95_02805 [Rhodanobacteraceae bacterium]|nr:hypothetical protein [Rhodanobacteraceae bacterium]